MKKHAFTLAEVLISMVILGIVFAITVKNINLESFDEKKYKIAAAKVLNDIDTASSKILSKETLNVPTGGFIRYIGATPYYSLYNTNSTILMTDSANVINLFSKYIKMTALSGNFCQYSNIATCPATGIGAARLAGDVYVGFKVTATSSATASCSNYYRPNTETKTSASSNYKISLDQSKQQCWANLYIDVDGKKGPGTEGHDYFVISFNQDGLARYLSD